MEGCEFLFQFLKGKIIFIFSLTINIKGVEGPLPMRFQSMVCLGLKKFICLSKLVPDFPFLLKVGRRKLGESGISGTEAVALLPPDFCISVLVYNNGGGSGVVDTKRLR